jgi:hypothetical protein
VRDELNRLETSEIDVSGALTAVGEKVQAAREG